MIIIWLIGVILTAGLALAYLRSNLDKYELEDMDEEPTVLIITAVVALLWPISLPIIGVYKLGKRIFSKRGG